MIAIAWIIFAAVILVLLVFCYLVVKYYQDDREAEKLPTFISVLGLTLTLLCVFLIPVDIYNASSTRDSQGTPLLTPEEIDFRNNALRIIYYVLYSLILAFAFGIIPFAYFYYEEDDEHVTMKQKIWGGCKYTIFLIVIVTVLLAVGLFLFFVKPGNKPTNGQNAAEWIQQILKNENVAESALNFAIASLTVIGYLCWITYTAYGLSALPIGIIKGRKHIAEEESEVSQKIEQTKAKQNAIKSKYLSGEKKINKKDEDQMNLLKREERVLARHNSRLEQSKSGWRKAWAAVRPFMFLFGFVFILVSLLIVISMVLTNVDKAMHSSNFCGSQCGFLLAYPQIVNPIDTILTALAKYFPVDYVVLAGLILYIFFATLSGIVKIGIRFLWVHMYTIKKKGTAPQGLLFTAIILMFSILSLNMEVTTLAPQYANFGTQMFYNETANELQRCSLDAPPGNCTMTQIGTIINRIQARMSFFGIIFYYASWIFIGCFLIGSVIAMIRSKSSNIEKREDDSDEDES